MIRNQGQRELWELLVKVSDFLEEHNLEYYLFAGTTIGALRHEGFIPWDDDLDIVMDRKNYYKLLEMADNLPWDDIELVSHETSDKYFRPYAQFARKDNTNFLKSGMFNRGECMGTLLDVFVMDEVPSSRLKEYEKDLLLFQETLAEPFTYKNEIVSYADECIKLRKEAESGNKMEVVERLKAKLESYAEDECDHLVVRFYFNRQHNHFKKDGFKTDRTAIFEGREFPIAGNQEDCLRVHYGYDWYLIPNAQEQETHGFFLNYDISANNYAEDMDKFLNWDEVYSNLRKRKNLVLERLKYKSQVDKTNAQFAATRTLLRAGIASGDTSEKIKSAYDQGNFPMVSELASELTDNYKVFSSADIGINGFTEELIAMWMHSLVVDGRYYRAEKAIEKIMPDWREKDILGFNVLKKCLTLAEAWQDHEYDKLNQTVTSLDENDWKLIPEYLIGIHELALQGIIEEDREHMNSLCDEYLVMFPTNAEVTKIKADCLLDNGQESEAMELYARAYAESTNGLLLLELQKRFKFPDWFC